MSDLAQLIAAHLDDEEALDALYDAMVARGEITMSLRFQEIYEHLHQSREVGHEPDP